MSEIVNNVVEETIEINFDKLMTDIAETLNSIESNNTNIFIIKKCAIIDIKLDEIRSRKYSNIDTIEAICNSIINNDISKMRGVLNQPEEMYTRINDLESQVKHISSVYL